jgi:hypothetical protein
MKHPTFCQRFAVVLPFGDWRGAGDSDFFNKIGRRIGVRRIATMWTRMRIQDRSDARAVSARFLALALAGFAVLSAALMAAALS